MRDQASALRQLVLHTAREDDASGIRAPRMLAVAGGRAGVGTTTLAVHLSAALSNRGMRIVLVDVDLHPSQQHASVAKYCQLGATDTLEDVLKFRRDIHEVLQPGPAGIQVVPGVAESQTAVSTTAVDRLLNQCRAMGRHADLVVLDTGNRVGQSMQKCWQQADELVMVTTPSANAIMDSYATMKALASAYTDQPVYCAVNQVSSTGATAENVFRRLDRSCRRFLRFGMRPLPAIPRAAQLRESAINDPRCAPHDCPAGAALRDCAEKLAIVKPNVSTAA